MGMLVLIIGIVALVYISKKGNKKTEYSNYEKYSENNIYSNQETKEITNEEFKKQAKEIIKKIWHDEKVIYEGSKDEVIYARIFCIRAEGNIEKASLIAQATVIKTFEKNGFSLDLSKEKTESNGKYIMWQTFFKDRPYILKIEVAPGKNKTYIINIALLNKNLVILNNLVNLSVEKEQQDKLKNDINSFFIQNDLPFFDYEANEKNVLLCKAKKWTKQEIDIYFKEYERQGYIKTGLNFDVKVGLYTDKTVANLADFLAEKGYNFKENFSNPEKNENKTRYRMFFDNSLMCTITEAILYDRAYLTLILGITEN